MAARPSRTYKLKLSPGGIALLLDCHNRLCHLAGDLLSYGTTLRVSVMMLQTRPDEELVAQLGRDELLDLTGDQVRFVGTCSSVAVATARMLDRAQSSGAFAKVPRTWLLFVAALSHMHGADDAVVRRIHEGLRASGDQTLR